MDTNCQIIVVSQVHLQCEEVFTTWKIQSVVYWVTTSVISQVNTNVLVEHDASTFTGEIKDSRTSLNGGNHLHNIINQKPVYKNCSS
jgi:hypothetical protein